MTEPDDGQAPALAGFWGGGFEGADHVNGRGDRLDLAAMHGHRARLDDDHAGARRAGLSWVRESIGWRLSEPVPGRWDLRRARRIAHSAERAGLQVAWTLWHYGLPPDLSLHDDRLIPRFAAFAAEVARVIGRASVRPPVFTPVNEINFLSWAASQRGTFFPPNNTPDGDDESSLVSGYAIKRRLVRAALAAMAAMRDAEPRCRFLHVEPVIHVAAPEDRPSLAPLAAEVRGWQWQSWDMLAGRADPELGGHPQALDLLGVNHYAASQWEVGTEERLHWHLRDPRRQPFSALLTETWQRYRRPVVVAETGHVGVGRGDWLDDIADEVRRARAAGVRVDGLCLFPLVDRPDWDAPERWHRSGLWHVPSGRPTRRVAEPVYAAALAAWQRALPEPAATTRRLLLVFAPRPWGPAPHRTREIAERLAGRWHVVFVEPAAPVEPGRAARVEAVARGPDIVSLRPRVDAAAGGDELRRTLVDLLRDWWLAERQPQPLAWVAAPLALPLARALEPSAIVVDAACAGAAAASAADVALVVRDRGPLADPVREWLLADGVDRRLFVDRRAGGWEAEESRALLASVPAPFVVCPVMPDSGGLAHVVALARARPRLSVVVAAFNEGDPPVTNLHFVGELPQRLLPDVFAAAAAVLLPAVVEPDAPPLAVWQAWAAGRPVVALGDGGTSPGLRLGVDADGLTAACDAALAESRLDRRVWRHALRQRLDAAQWTPRIGSLARRLEAMGG